MLQANAYAGGTARNGSSGIMIETLQQWDRAVLLWIHQGWSHPALDRFFLAFASAKPFLIPFAIVCGWLLWRGGRRGRLLVALLLAGVCVTDPLVHHILKPLFARVRPCFVVDGVRALSGQSHSPSFPSSHAANVFCAATIVAGRLGRRWLWLLVLAAIVGISRVYIGVHYPSDILAGAGLGMLVGWGMLAVGNALEQRVCLGRERRADGAASRNDLRARGGDPEEAPREDLVNGNARRVMNHASGGRREEAEKIAGRKSI
ncbi:MAG: phosphatase PAP2 family protein [Candidatus Eisenbacteria bacterium]|nr:phosphatase PAP2 family protein [Candidatus Eisenbacteria bacterium]